VDGVGSQNRPVNTVDRAALAKECGEEKRVGCGKEKEDFKIERRNAARRKGPKVTGAYLFLKNGLSQGGGTPRSRYSERRSFMEGSASGPSYRPLRFQGPHRKGGKLECRLNRNMQELMETSEERVLQQKRFSW